MINLSENEMLALWKRVMHIDVMRRECNVERDDGIMLDDMLLTHLRQWYAHLLASAPLTWVPIEDLRAEIQISSTDDGIVTAMIPERCVRPVEWQLAVWKHSVTEFHPHSSATARAQWTPWLRAGNENPIIIKHDNRLTMYSTPAGITPVLLMARCVVTPAANHYVCHQEALSTLPKWNESLNCEC